MLISIVFALVDFACRYAVAEHFFDVSQGHFNGFVHLGGWVDIVPIFKVVAVAPLVVHPCGRVSVQLPFLFVGAAGAEIIFSAPEKLRWRILG